MQIRPANPHDLPTIRRLYDEAIAFQQQGGHPSWTDLDPDVIVRDIAARCQYVVLAGQAVAGIFSLCPPSALDRYLWEGREPDAAMYMNRIIVARAWRGRRLFGRMLDWCEQDARRQEVALLRLDTWAQNQALAHYYASFGFVHLGERTTPADATLPSQYRGLRLALMERPVPRRPQGDAADGSGARSG